MRAGGCTVQQALTPEAAAVVKQAVTLARRRGHAQVTPLHVASTMLSSPTGLLRSACLQSHSHPLQCKALELCFNVALNRLPASSSPLLGGPHHLLHHHHPPSLSNALVAAFKRAQAHQRRGSVESQQQPLLAVKIELEQLMISILDDPSVSRVMREAGFSSTQVKVNVEQAVSVEIVAPTSQYSNPNPSSSKPRETIKPTRTLDPVTRNEDVTSVIETLASGRRRSVVVVGECLASTEGVIRGVMDTVEKCEVPEVLRSLQFITLPLFSFRNLGREEVEQKVGELRCLVTSCCAGRGGVLYLGDLNWAAEYWATSLGEKCRGYYCPVEHVIMEIRSLVCGGFGGESGVIGGRFWVMGIASYQTYTKCRVGSPSLEAVLGLHPLTIPSGSLELSLSCDSDSQSLFKSNRTGDGHSWRPLLKDGKGNQLTCCRDCSIKFENEARVLPKVSSSSQGPMITSNLPSWLQQYKEENKRSIRNDKESMQELCKKWNSICNSTHKHQHHYSEITLHLSSVSPSSSSSSISSYNQSYPSLHQSLHPWPVSKHQWRENHLCMPETIDEGVGHSSRFDLGEHEGQRPSTLPGSNPNPNPNSSSSSDSMEMEYLSKFKELNAENLKIICNALEKTVSWQNDIIPEIASTVLQCRSGMRRRKKRSKLTRNKEETWLFFQGGDIEGKEKIARELASLVFGSYANLVSIELSSFSSTRSGSTEDLRNKRSRSEASHSYLERFFEAVRENPHRVFLVEDIEQVDSYSQMGIKAAIEMGKIRSSGGEEASTGDAIVVLSCENFDSRSRACFPPVKQKLGSAEMKDQESEKEMDSSAPLDLNHCVADEDVEDCSFGDVGLLESVDRAFFFKLREDL